MSPFGRRPPVWISGGNKGDASNFQPPSIAAVWCLHGRPRGRSVDCKPKRCTTACTQASDPHGRRLLSATKKHDGPFVFPARLARQTWQSSREQRQPEKSDFANYSLAVGALAC